MNKKKYPFLLLKNDLTKKLYVLFLQDARDDLFTYNPEYEQLRELGRQIMQADMSKGTPVQANLSEVNTAWDQIQALLAQKHQAYSGTANLWQQYNDAKQGVARVLEDIEPVTSQDVTFTTQPEVKKALDQHKVRAAVVMIALYPVNQYIFVVMHFHDFPLVDNFTALYFTKSIHFICLCIFRKCIYTAIKFAIETLPKISCAVKECMKYLHLQCIFMAEMIDKVFAIFYT